MVKLRKDDFFLFFLRVSFGRLQAIRCVVGLIGILCLCLFDTCMQTHRQTHTGHLKNAVDFLLPPRLEPDSVRQECQDAQFHCQSKQ